MKKLSIILFAAAFMMVSFKRHAADVWSLDVVHSNLVFSVNLFGLSDIKGTFVMKEGTITSSKEDFSDATVSIVADANSIDTDQEDRDKHLRTADYFDAAKYPDITFKSTSFKKTGDKFTVTGDLSFHGITKPVTLTAIGKTGMHPVMKKALAGFRVTGTIKRSDFNISAATPAAMLSDDVAIESNLQFLKN